MSVKKLNLKKILGAFSLFCISFIIFLLIWLKIKSYYGLGIVSVATYFLSKIRNLKVEKLFLNGDKIFLQAIQPVLTAKGLADLSLEAEIHISAYTFNTPLSLALLCGLRSFVSWPLKRLLEVIIILIAIHFLYVFFFIEVNLVNFLAQMQISTPSRIVEEFIWTFIDNFLIRFEPFLLTLYVLWRETKWPLAIK